MSSPLSNLVVLIRRFPYCTVCLLLTVIFGAASWYLRGHVQELEQTHTERAREGEAMLALLVTGSTQRQELALVHDTTRRIEDNLVIEANLAENLWYFYKLEEQTKARLPELHQLNSPSTDSSPLFRRVPYTLRIVGTFDQVSAFLLGLETGPRLIKITSFGFARQTGGSGIALDLNLDMLGKK